jgi:PKD repeat protein
MSIVAVHGPHTWGQPFFAKSDNILVNLLGPSEFEFKSNFDGGAVLASEDPYEWDFGDGTQLVNGFEVRHVFATPGTFVVQLTIDTTEGPVVDQVEITIGPDGTGLKAEEEPEETTPEAA